MTTFFSVNSLKRGLHLRPLTYGQFKNTQGERMSQAQRYNAEVVPLLKELKQTCERLGFPLLYHVVKGEDESTFNISSYIHACGKAIPEELAAAYYMVVQPSDATRVAAGLVLMEKPAGVLFRETEEDRLD